MYSWGDDGFIGIAGGGGGGREKLRGSENTIWPKIEFL